MDCSIRSWLDLEKIILFGMLAFFGGKPLVLFHSRAVVTNEELGGTVSKITRITSHLCGMNNPGMKRIQLISDKHRSCHEQSTHLADCAA